MKKLMFLAITFLLFFTVNAIAGGGPQGDGDYYIEALYVNGTPWTGAETEIYFDTTYSVAMDVHYMRGDDGGPEVFQNTISGNIYLPWWNHAWSASADAVGIVATPPPDSEVTSAWYFMDGPLSVPSSVLGFPVEGGERTANIYLEFDFICPTLSQEITLLQRVPEPSTMLLLGIGLVGLAGFGRKKIFKK